MAATTVAETAPDQLEEETESSEESESSEEEQTDDTAKDTARVSKTPLASRFIVEKAMLQSLISTATICLACKKECQLELQLTNVCVATIGKISCSGCGKETTVEPQHSKYGKEPKKNNKKTYRNRDYSTNICFVTAFTACGDGPGELKEFVLFLDCPMPPQWPRVPLDVWKNTYGPPSRP
ncbi:hypothetical protein SEMRO_1076_G238530.1 [Seminavis robusta]|uniref:Uncharacterized protein n=1 Tax=Seminavis robusta TaxID=568900 RepID=A0A9N8EER4_9STRA|nr:hypothetical protein SEMRO_1076_G238530.1 [Seminavis robusta]|eukprot:Sro1076_g238530.1 n/a (181) ;mRNA; f:18266-18808